MLEEVNGHQASPWPFLQEPLGCEEIWPLGCKTIMCHDLDVTFVTDREEKWEKPNSSADVVFEKGAGEGAGQLFRMMAVPRNSS